MRPLSICILGGTGFVGTQLCARLVRDGHSVRVLTRNRDRARHLIVLPGLELVDADVHAPRVLERHFAGRDAVINLVGILNERGRSGAGFRAAHAELARKVVAACRDAHVPRLLHMSSLRAGENAPSHYLRSKGEAERILREECGDVAWTVFQPSVIFGAGDGFLNRFAGLLRLLPFLPLARAGTRFAPVYVGDVVEAMARALDDPRTREEALQLCGPEVMTLRELVCYVRTLLGVRRAVFGIPDWLGGLQATVMDFVPGKPLSIDNFRSLQLDSVCTESGLARLGIEPTSLRAIAPNYIGDRQRAARLDRFRRAAGNRIEPVTGVAAGASRRAETVRMNALASLHRPAGLAAIVLASLALLVTSPARADAPLEEAEVRAFMDEVAAASRARDLERLAAVLASDCRIEVRTRFEGRELVNRLDRTEYLAALSTGFASLRDLQAYDYEQQDVQVSLVPGGTAALVRSRITETVVFMQGRIVTVSDATSRVERRGGRLALVSVEAVTRGE